MSHWTRGSQSFPGQIIDSTGAAAYGAGWEERGRSQLAERAAALLMMLLHGSAVTAGGTGSASVTSSLAPKVAAAKFAGLSGWQIAALYTGAPRRQ